MAGHCFRNPKKNQSSRQELRKAEQEMMEQFQMMMDTYHLQQRKLRDRKEWVNNDRTWHGPFKDEPPSEMTVTHINQTKDLYVSHPPSGVFKGGLRGLSPPEIFETKFFLAESPKLFRLYAL